MPVPDDIGKKPVSLSEERKIELKKLLGHVMNLIKEKRFERPDRANFKYKPAKLHQTKTQ